jgi:hypothetical protein
MDREGRCETVAGSYWDGVSAGGDAYIIKSVLLDTTDEEAATLLRNVRNAMGPAAHPARHRAAHWRPQ